MPASSSRLPSPIDKGFSCKLQRITICHHWVFCRYSQAFTLVHSKDVDCQANELICCLMPSMLLPSQSRDVPVEPIL